MVVSELRGEKIDIIPYNEEPARFVAKALSPARVREVLVDDEDRQATVIVPDDQLSLAIGREGQNARLAAKLTGWRVDIKSESEFAQEDEEIENEGEEQFDGRCSAVLSAGRRCPNAALAGLALLRPAPAPGARPLRDQPGDRAGRLCEDEVAMLADPDADERSGVEPADRRARPRGRRGVVEAAAEAEAAESLRPGG